MSALRVFEEAAAEARRRFGAGWGEGEQVPQSHASSHTPQNSSQPPPPPPPPPPSKKKQAGNPQHLQRLQASAEKQAQVLPSEGPPPPPPPPPSKKKHASVDKQEQVLPSEALREQLLAEVAAAGTRRMRRSVEERMREINEIEKSTEGQCGRVVEDERGQPEESESLNEPNPQARESADIFSVGTRVEGRWKGHAAWYSGTVRGVNEDGTLWIDFDDGDVERRQPRSHTRLPAETKQREEVEAERETAVEERRLQEMLALASEVLSTIDGGPFRFGRLFVVGEGRAGKTAFSRSLQGRVFEETESTVGVSSALVEVDRVELEGGASEQQWKRYVPTHKELEQAQARIVAKASRRREHERQREGGTSTGAAGEGDEGEAEEEGGHGENIVNWVKRQGSDVGATEEAPRREAAVEGKGEGTEGSEEELTGPDAAGRREGGEGEPGDAAAGGSGGGAAGSSRAEGEGGDGSEEEASHRPGSNPEGGAGSSVEGAGGGGSGGGGEASSERAAARQEASGGGEAVREAARASSEGASGEGASGEGASGEGARTAGQDGGEEVKVQDGGGGKREVAGPEVAAPGAAAATKLDMDLVFECHRHPAEPLKLSLWDFGGQDVFYTLHHLFLSRFGVYLVTFSMEWLSPAAPAATSRQCLSFLRFWLLSIAVHTRDASGRAGAPVLLVGTHKDVIATAAVHEAISDLLHHEFGDHPVWAGVEPFRKAKVSTGTGLLWFHPVDNRLGREDSVVCEVMRSVERLVEAEEYIKRRVPLQWIAVFDELRADKRTAIALQELCSLARTHGLPVTQGISLEAEVRLMARFFSGLGFIMFHEEPSLSNLVIINPADFLIEPATMIVCNFRIHFLPQHDRARRAHPHLWGLLSRQGVLDVQLLEVLWADFENRRELELLMVKFGLMVPLVAPQRGALAAEPGGGAAGNASVAEAARDGGGAGAAGAAGSAGQYLIQYLIPAVLPERDAAGGAGGKRARLTFFLVFATADVFEVWARRGHVSTTDVRREGFFPSGVFARILGKAVSWSQATTGNGVENMELSQRSATLAYGSHQFALINVDDAFVRVEVHVQSSQLAVMALYEQTQAVLSECVANLRCGVAVPSDGGSRTGGYEAFEGALALLYGTRGLIEVETAGGSMYVAAGERLEAEDLRERFDKFLPPRGLRASYDAFVSYRWGPMDSDLASGMFMLLSQEIVDSRGVQVFLDKERLQGGRNFQRDFCRALASSAVAVPLVSIAALRRMLKLKPDDDVDNLLLEWSLIVELQELGRLQACCPILLGRPLEQEELAEGKGAGVMTSLFVPGGPADLPAIVCRKVVQEVSEVLRKLEPPLQPSAGLRTRTVRETVQLLTKNLGVTAWNVQDNHGLARDHSSQLHMHARFKGALLKHAVGSVMSSLRRTARQPPPPQEDAARNHLGEHSPTPDGPGGSGVGFGPGAAGFGVTAGSPEVGLALAEAARVKAEAEGRRLSAEAQVRMAEAERAKTQAELSRVKAELMAAEARAKLAEAEARQREAEAEAEKARAESKLLRQQLEAGRAGSSCCSVQ